MAITLEEAYASPTIDGKQDGVSRAHIIYIARGSSSDTYTDCYAQALLDTPSAIGSLNYRSIRVQEVAGADDPLWEVDVTWTRDDGTLPGGAPRRAFNTGGGSVKIYTSRNTRLAKHKNGGTSGDGIYHFDGQIGVAEDGTVSGVDIFIPVFEWEEIHTKAADDVTEDYLGDLYRLTGKTNATAFRFFAAEECLFLGASGSTNERGNWEITFKFAGSPNLTEIPPAQIGGISGVPKKGWDYVWVFTKMEADTGADFANLKPTIVQANVEQVYPTGAFGDLLIGF